MPGGCSEPSIDAGASADFRRPPTVPHSTDARILLRVRTQPVLRCERHATQLIFSQTVSTPDTRDRCPWIQQDRHAPGLPGRPRRSQLVNPSTGICHQTVIFRHCAGWTPRKFRLGDSSPHTEHKSGNLGSPRSFRPQARPALTMNTTARPRPRQPHGADHLTIAHQPSRQRSFPPGPTGLISAETAVP